MLGHSFAFVRTPEIYKPKDRLYGIRCDSFSSFINSSFHMRRLPLLSKSFYPTRAPE
jgi:hypothetical protein